MSDKSMKTEKALPVILRQEVVAQSRLFRVEALQLRFSNGEERVYERIPGGNRHAVMIVPVLNNDTLLLIREYAAGTHTYELGFPKGLVDAGETDEEAANRELQEEIFMAHDLYPQQLAGDEPEELEVVPWPLHDAEALLDHPQFHEARSVAALLLFLRQSRQESPSAQQD